MSLNDQEYNLTIRIKMLVHFLPFPSLMMLFQRTGSFTPRTAFAIKGFLQPRMNIECMQCCMNKPVNKISFVFLRPQIPKNHIPSC